MVTPSRLLLRTLVGVEMVQMGSKFGVEIRLPVGVEMKQRNLGRIERRNLKRRNEEGEIRGRNEQSRGRNGRGRNGRTQGEIIKFGVGSSWVKSRGDFDGEMNC